MRRSPHAWPRPGGIQEGRKHKRKRLRLEPRDSKPFQVVEKIDAQSSDLWATERHLDPDPLHLVTQNKTGARRPILTIQNLVHDTPPHIGILCANVVGRIHESLAIRGRRDQEVVLVATPGSGTPNDTDRIVCAPPEREAWSVPPMAHHIPAWLEMASESGEELGPSEIARMLGSEIDTDLHLTHDRWHLKVILAVEGSTEPSDLHQVWLLNPELEQIRYPTRPLIERLNVASLPQGSLDISLEPLMLRLASQPQADRNPIDHRTAGEVPQIDLRLQRIPPNKPSLHFRYRNLPVGKLAQQFARLDRDEVHYGRQWASRSSIGRAPPYSRSSIRDKIIRRRGDRLEQVASLAFSVRNLPGGRPS